VADPTVAELLAVIGELRVELAEARTRIADLEARLNASSRNSSKPPSSDGLGRPAPKSLRRPGARKPGGQPGHPGSRLEQVAYPDSVVRHEPVACGGCGGALVDAVEVGVQSRQVFDLPPIAVQVVEHQLVRRRCRCGAVTIGQAPAGVVAPVQYGPRICAAMTYLTVGQFLPNKRTADILAELCGIPVSPGTVTAVTERAAAAVTGSGFLDVVRDALTRSEVVHFDETGFRVEGKLHWVHSASTSQYSLLTCHRKRGVAAMNDMGVLPAFTGIAVHDAWAPYDTYTGVTHALCNAHVLRELTAVTDSTGVTGSTGPEDFDWAAQAADALLDLKTLVEDAVIAGSDHVEENDLDRHALLLRSAATYGLQQNQGLDGKLAAKHRALARRLLARQADYVRFANDLRVPFDNNPAEREIRMVKLRQKVSGCLRTLAGAEQFCTIRSYLATARKHGTRFYDALTMLAQGRPWIPTTA
jgi:transposase